MARARTTKRNAPWALHEAKAHLSDVVDRAATEGPQVITRHGRKEAVVLAFDAYCRLAGQEVSLIDLLLSAPRGTGVVIENSRELPRDIELEP